MKWVMNRLSNNSFVCGHFTGMAGKPRLNACCDFVAAAGLNIGADRENFA
jgi:hypothetical protein